MSDPLIPALARLVQAHADFAAATAAVMADLAVRVGRRADGGVVGPPPDVEPPGGLASPSVPEDPAEPLAVAQPATRKRRRPSVRTPERLERLIEMLMPSAPARTRADLTAELNALPGPLVRGVDVTNWVDSKRLREVAAAAESARAVLGAEPLQAPAPVPLQPEADPVRPDDEALQSEADATQPTPEPVRILPATVAPSDPPPSGPRFADGFVGVTDHVTRAARMPAGEPETMTWSAVENYAVLNRIPIVGTKSDVLAAVNALRDKHELPRWRIVPDRPGAKEKPFPPLVAPRNGQVDAYVAVQN